MPRYCPRCGETLHSHGTTKGETRKTARKAYEPAKKDRKPNAYNAKYSMAFKKVEGRFKKKGGGWKLDGFKRAQKAAHKEAKK